ncbi:hypothetical protein BDZ94DRAFT_1382522 [Collybia nuda]|uniref:Uncharacterized protein n=1 Tax=Collybia nuda TaxID=64659 RepID=A0A9P6CP71_9AGAR|nr:hypothetical protein BDZ94DRAFT_1382522 [Collybia nuda]
MDSTTTFPLPLLPTIPDNLDDMDSRKSIRYINTFMKNALIRGLNNVYTLAELVEDSETILCSFLDYALVVCDMICLHIEGTQPCCDESFFTTPNSEGVALLKILGKSSNMNDGGKMYNDIKALQQKIYAWKESPSTYSPNLLRMAVIQFAQEVYWKMEKQRGRLPNKTQVESMDADVLAKAITDKALRSMIDENLQWLASHSDITYLLPFVLSHHDVRTSSYWPSVSPEGLEMVPELVMVHAECWEFAPIDPVTREVKTRK